MIHRRYQCLQLEDVFAENLFGVNNWTCLSNYAYFFSDNVMLARKRSFLKIVDFVLRHPGKQPMSFWVLLPFCFRTLYCTDCISLIS